MEREIIFIEPNSPAARAKLKLGDIIIAIDGVLVCDALDFWRVEMNAKKNESFIFTLKRGERIFERAIKGGSGVFGISFKNWLMDKGRVCKNNCPFCFVAQNPKGMRPKAYIKDDDPRTSFLYGNYVTLTNINKPEAERIAALKLSPLYVSLQAISPKARAVVFGKTVPDPRPVLEIFIKAGIKLCLQIVLVKGLNDEEILDETLNYSESLGDAVISCAIVPVGLTKHRAGLKKILPFAKKDAQELIKKMSSRAVTLADEWFLLAEVSIPPVEYYGDFAQLENGVGLWRSFSEDFVPIPKEKSKKISVITGSAAAPLLRSLLPEETPVLVIENNFFGKSVTVAGLLTASDIFSAKPLLDKKRELYLPPAMFRDCVTLDGKTVSDISKFLGVPVNIDGF